MVKPFLIVAKLPLDRPVGRPLVCRYTGKEDGPVYENRTKL